jgi:pyruvate/2-oxoacid:ferredoxin oxidoreductase beta subunit
MKYTIQVAPEDCTGCGAVREVCPAKDKTNPKHKAINMAPQSPLREPSARTTTSSSTCPSRPRQGQARRQGLAVLQPLFEYSGACAGCGETPYVKLLTQLFGDRLLIANATGCSSIYGGNLPTTPYTTRTRRPRPGLVQLAVRGQRRVRLGLRLAVDKRASRRASCSSKLRGADRRRAGRRLLLADQTDRGASPPAARARRRAAQKLARSITPRRAALELADYLVKKSVWIVGGDGWAYDIGYGGLDHVLASAATSTSWCSTPRSTPTPAARQSKATPLGAAAKFAAAGKAVAQEGPRADGDELRQRLRRPVAFGAKDAQTVKAFLEAESYPARRSSSPTATASRTATTWRTARAAEAGGGQRVLAAVPLRPAAPRRASSTSSARSQAVTIPVAVKLSPFFSSIASLARSLDEAGANGLVLFNRFYQPDIDVEALEATPSLHLSDSSELLLRLRWLAILTGQVRASLAVSGGVHTAVDAVKAVMTGASAVQVVSRLLQEGPGQIAVILDGLAPVARSTHEYESLEQMRGSMSLRTSPDPSAFERVNYVRLLMGWAR